MAPPPLVKDKVTLALMRALNAMLDPIGILNSGKVAALIASDKLLRP